MQIPSLSTTYSVLAHHIAPALDVVCLQSCIMVRHRPQQHSPCNFGVGAAIDADPCSAAIDEKRASENYARRCLIPHHRCVCFFGGRAHRWRRHRSSGISFFGGRDHRWRSLGIFCVCFLRGRADRWSSYHNTGICSIGTRFPRRCGCSQCRPLFPRRTTVCLQPFSAKSLHTKTPFPFFSNLPERTRRESSRASHVSMPFGRPKTEAEHVRKTPSELLQAYSIRQNLLGVSQFGTNGVPRDSSPGIWCTHTTQHLFLCT
jgi:hypothetical protein